MGGSSSIEEFGPPTADYHMNIQYCGGWGYRPKAVYAKGTLIYTKFGLIYL